jgi:hypothetical protein
MRRCAGPGLVARLRGSAGHSRSDAAAPSGCTSDISDPGLAALCRVIEPRRQLRVFRTPPDIQDRMATARASRVQGWPRGFGSSRAFEPRRATEGSGHLGWHPGSAHSGGSRASSYKLAAESSWRRRTFKDWVQPRLQDARPASRSGAGRAGPGAVDRCSRDEQPRISGHRPTSKNAWQPRPQADAHRHLRSGLAAQAPAPAEHSSRDRQPRIFRTPPDTHKRMATAPSGRRAQAPQIRAGRAGSGTSRAFKP